MAAEGRGARFVGQRVPRTEDARFLTGTGAYVDDIKPPGALHVAFLRSDAARGTLEHLDLSAAAAMPGVVDVLGADDLNHRVGEWWADVEGRSGQERPYRLFAAGDVRYVGEPIAMVVAESRYLAEDAVEAIDVSIEPLPPVSTPGAAVQPDAPLVHPEKGSNILLELPAVEDPGLESAFEAASHTFTETFRQHRYACVPMETRGTLASWEPATKQLTVWISTQGPYAVQCLLARMLGIPETNIRVVMPDVGGAFGQKMFPKPEEVATVLAAVRLGRPVRWTEDRHENLLCGEHAREDEATVSFAVDDEGHITAAKVDFLESLGAYPAPASSALLFSAMVFPGPYRIPAFAASGRAVFSNTAGRGSYRGPWMVETVVREQMVDHVARELGLDPLELRRRNAVRSEDLPYVTAAGLLLDDVSMMKTLDQAAEIIGYEDFRAHQRRAREDGRLLGIGMSLIAEPSAMSFGWFSTDAAVVRVGLGGQVEVAITSAGHGQGHETTVAQVVADELGVGVEDVRVVQGDTALTPFGPGTGGSRTAVVVAGAARQAASQVHEQVVSVAANVLEAASEDLVIEYGRVHVVGTPDRSVPVSEVARAAYLDLGKVPAGQAPGLEALVRYTPSSPFTWSNACHMCTCEVDPATGEVEILRYVVSEDCGVMINPTVVEGQIAGGVVQGIGGVLLEHLSYDDDANPLATTFVDYLLPTSTEVPEIEYGHIETPSPTNPGGHKGMGEGGAIGSPPAVLNAVADALAHLGVQLRHQPLAPSDVVDLIATAGERTQPAGRS